MKLDKKTTFSVLVMISLLLSACSQPKETAQKNPQQNTQGKCGDGVCGPMEKANLQLCPQDCPQESNKPAPPPAQNTTAPSPSPVPSASDDSRFGVNDAFLGNVDTSSTELIKAFLQTRCSLLEDLGAGWARGPSKLGMIWEEIEPRKGEFDFSSSDLGADPCNGDVEWDMSFMPYPPWEQGWDAGGNTGDLPARKPYTDEQDLIDFLTAYVERYDGDGIDDAPNLKKPVKYWELGNEPGLVPYFNNDTKRYFDFLKTGYTTIRKAAPDAMVLIGGMAGSEFDSEKGVGYMGKLLDMGACDYFDVMNFHNYDYATDSVEKQVKEYSSLLEEHGCEKEIWLTETGLTGTNQGPQPWLSGSPSLQAEWVVKGFVLGFAAGVEKIFWHNLVDTGHSFGIVSAEGVKRPAYYTYKLMVSKLDGFVSVATLARGQYEFSFADKKPIYVLWSENGEKTIDFSSHIKTANVKLTHIVEQPGDTEPKMQTVPTNAIPISESPVFMEEV